MSSVNVKPAQVCAVSMLPIKSGSESSLTLAENWAESATAAALHTKHSSPNRKGEPPNSRPTASAHALLNVIATMVVRVRQ